MWADSHCHIDYDGVGHQAIDDAKRSGVGRLVTIGTDAASSAAAIATARSHDGVWATVGLHPHEASNGVGTLLPLLDPPDPVVVGVGECGLDYYYEHSPREAQRSAFADQIRLAHRLGKTLVIHTRDAWDETFAILADEGVPDRTIVHCFSGGPAEAEKALALGAFLSFSGIVTFKRATDVQRACMICPIDRLLVETDSPYLAPVPNRGKPNRPGWVPLVGEMVARLRGVDVADIEHMTWENTARVFGLDT